MTFYRGHTHCEGDDLPATLPDSFGAAGSLVLGWLVWLRAWLMGEDFGLVRGGTEPRIVAGRAKMCVSDEWADCCGWRDAYRRHIRQGYKHEFVVIAMTARLGSQSVVHRRWRRLFRVYVDFTRRLRGDAVLPCAHARLPEGGCGPPAHELKGWQSSVLPPYPRASKRAP